MEYKFRSKETFNCVIEGVVNHQTSSVFVNKISKEFFADFFFFLKLSHECMQLLVSISSSFYKQLLHKYPFAKKSQSQTVIREKLQRPLLYKKGSSKIKC